MLLLQHIIKKLKYNTTNLLICTLPLGMNIVLFLCGKLIRNEWSKLPSSPIQMFYYEHYFHVSFLIDIIRFSQLIINENKGDRVIRHDSCNKQNIPCINKETKHLRQK